MMVGSIQIQTTPARIGLRNTPPRQDLRTELPKTSMETTKPQLNMRQNHAQVVIDQYPSRASAGLKNNADMMAEYAETGRGVAMGGIARRASEGDQLRSIENKGNMIASIAESALGTGEIPEIDIGWSPSAPPIIQYRPEGSPIKIEAVRGEVDVNTERGSVQNQVQWGKVEMYLQQQNSITMTPPAVNTRI